MNPYHNLDKLKAAMEEVRQTCSYQRKRLANTSLVLPRLGVVSVFFTTSVVVKLFLHSFALGALVATLGTCIAVIL